MSTRSVIAEPHGDGFRGRYHHFDGYPSGVGAQLWELYHGHFTDDGEAMRQYLITDEPQGWSNIIGADFSLPKGWHDANDRDEPCALCDLPLWRHYRQYYPTGARLPFPDQVLQLDHGHQSIPVITGPQSYTCRGETSDEPEGYYITSDGDDGGTEWAYVLGARSLFIFERRFGMPHDDQGHGVGMFGLGASDLECGGYWAPVAELDWFGDEPDWDQLDEGSPLLAAAS